MKLLREHVAAARALLRLTQAELAALAGVGEATVARFENGETTLRTESLWRLHTALSELGIEFFNTGKPGVRYHPERDRRRLARTEPDRPVG